MKKTFNKKPNQRETNIPTKKFQNQNLNKEPI